MSDAWRKILVPYFATGWPPVIYCGDGWRTIIMDLVAKLDALDVPWKINQIKEKLGTLRVYAFIDDVDDEWIRIVSTPGYELSEHDKKKLIFNSKSGQEKDNLRHEFETSVANAILRSDWTCESCGADGSRRLTFPISTLCDICFEKM